jgi:hypothetical protein
MMLRGRVRVRYDNGVQPAIVTGTVSAQTDKAFRVDVDEDDDTTTRLWIFIHNIYTAEEL